VLVRCARCQAVYSVQDGLTGPVQRTFAVECGRCLSVFDVHSGHAPEGPRTPVPRRVSTPPPPHKTPPMHKPVAMVLPAGAVSSNGGRVNGDDPADLGALRPAIYGPVAKHNPLTAGGAIALAVVMLAGLVALLALNRPRIPREAAAAAQEARAALLLDDDGNLDHAAVLFGEADRLARGAGSYEADRALALLLRGSAKRDLAERLDVLAARDPGAAAERESALRDGARLIQEGAAAATAALQRDEDDAAAQRSVALAAALTSGNPRSWLKTAARSSGDDPLLTLVRVTAELSGPHDEAAEDRASAALGAAKRAEPRLLRAQVDAAALALDRRDLAAARQDLQAVLQANPKHERAKRLLSLVPP
jgi:predicted Zn finger-like uncharacterized protein